MAEASAILLSVRSPHVERLLDGTKTVELRRRPINVPPGTIVILYAAGDRKQIVGSVTAESTDTASPDELWKKYSNSVGVTRAEFDTYFAGSDVGYALTTSNPRRLAAPIELAEVRRRWEAFTTPQTYRRLGALEFGSIVNGERRFLV